MSVLDGIGVLGAKREFTMPVLAWVIHDLLPAMTEW